jgi:hypothetical protein
MFQKWLQGFQSGSLIFVTLFRQILRFGRGYRDATCLTSGYGGKFQFGDFRMFLGGTVNQVLRLRPLRLGVQHETGQHSAD